MSTALIKLENIKLLRVDPADLGALKDGDTFTWLVNKPKAGGVLKNSELGMILKAAGVQKLTDLKGFRLHLTEKVMRPWPKADGAYLYEVKKAGTGNGATAPAPIPPELTEAALTIIAAGSYTEGNFQMGLVQESEAIRANTPFQAWLFSSTKDNWLNAMVTQKRVTISPVDNTLTVTANA